MGQGKAPGLPWAAPWQPPGTQTTGVIQAGIAGIHARSTCLHRGGLGKIHARAQHPGGASPPAAAEAVRTAKIGAATPSPVASL
jgi:hypothetical protein